METMFWIWMAAALIFLVIEVGVPGLVFVCFSAGSIGAGIYAQFKPDEYLIQTAIFAIITILLIPLTRRFAKKISLGTAPESNIDALVGQPAIVVKEIIPLEATGQVRIQGEIWSASAETNIPQGSKVTVCGVDGNKLIVRPGVDSVNASDNNTAEKEG